MAKKAAINMAALAAVVAAGPNGTFGPENEAQALADAGFVEINDAVKDGDGNVAVRATEKGIAEVGGEAPSGKARFDVVDVPTDIIDSANAPRKSSRGGGERYPFSTLEVGKGFFVPASEKTPDPGTSLASTVSSATARFAEQELDEDGVPVTKRVTQNVFETDPETGKRVKNDDGKFTVIGQEEVDKPVMVNTRTFKLVPADGGAWVVRTA